MIQERRDNVRNNQLDIRKKKKFKYLKIRYLKSG